MPELRVDVVGPVATLTIDNAGKRNAVTGAMWDSFAPLLAELAANDDVSALVVRGAGTDFSAGADISDLQQILRDPAAGDGGHVTAGETALAEFPKPTVAAIDGFCVGGGWELAGACDIRISSDRSTFGVTPARLGILYPLSGVTRLVQLAGPAAAKHLILSGELVDAETAARWGMVSRLLPTEGFWGAIDAFVDTLVTRSRLTQQASKELIDLIASGDPRLTERAAFWDAEVAVSAEAAIGAAAFLSRETPAFTWRSPAT
ncbi:MAG: enoyl-CoA hydratase/isomerase family protein [Actinomycetota bacterium]|nr:enoyl-CoA hydratase/isomerase family protein [Actinomycetota bacterium]